MSYLTKQNEFFDGDLQPALPEPVEEPLLCPACGTQYQVSYGHRIKSFYAFHPMTSKPCAIREQYFAKALGRSEKQQDVFAKARGILYPSDPENF